MVQAQSHISEPKCYGKHQKMQKFPSHVGLEPTTFRWPSKSGIEV